MDRGCQGFERHIERCKAAQGSRQRGDSEGNVPQIAHDNHIGRQQVRLLRHELLQPRGAGFFGTFNEHLDADTARHVCPQCSEVGHYASFVVGRATAEKAASPGLGAVGWGLPAFVGSRRLHIVVSVEQDCWKPRSCRSTSIDGGRIGGDLNEVDRRKTSPPQEIGRDMSGTIDRLMVVSRKGNRRD